MAAHLNLRVALVALACLAAAGAQAGADPLRPSGAIAAPGAAEQVVGEGGPLLQSVILGKGRRPAALLNGELVEQGRTWGEYRLLKVSPSGVVLEGPQGRETVSLTPTVSIKPSTPPVASGKTKKETRGAKTPAGSPS